ncbi:MAG: alanine dehydrogenase/PNT domain protein [Aeromicrobium sp.]|jgi:alanine dehydrogenase|uniref:N(5)-(carboxyethyl)ornithine synthase n=1 Tax=Aeromicrobium sp. TaxID=1871063 RepID=UPI0026125094|nr:N(5)-(carboxyethyl)ornithine synthase [Aeromicrobium sp.]MCW2789287.1 alanine dehydrogenase/PNT domain protein [Aeromicrobium sp.]MCW2823616.1 alanine dehydrogenase/PNT domain protein [Aeromicrobium sp.]
MDLDLGVIARTAKENERRLPIHPRHLERLSDEVRPHVFLEEGYGEGFGVTDDDLRPLVGGLLPRAELIARCDVILLTKPQPSDLLEMREGQVLWGWPHCVQDPALTQAAIDRRLTLIAWEVMNHWGADGGFLLHVFHKNNELAGYGSVLHAMSLAGLTGTYGRRLTAAVIGFGATARGAVTALSAHGIHDVDIFTQRGVAAVSAPIHSARIVQFDPAGSPAESRALVDQEWTPLPALLAEHDVIVNCVLQDPNSPMSFLMNADLPMLPSGTLIVDVSCDEGMGFEWAKPTTFDEPSFTVGNGVTYYAVDHSPSYLWNSATWEISQALLPYVGKVLSGSAAWDADETLRRAIEIRDGVVQNPHILSFQKRSADYPHDAL